MAKVNPIYCPRCGGTTWSVCMGELFSFNTANNREEGRWSPMPVLVHCAGCYPKKSSILSEDDTDFVLSNAIFKRLMSNPREEIVIEQPKKTLKAKLKRKAKE